MWTSDAGATTSSGASSRSKSLVREKIERSISGEANRAWFEDFGPTSKQQLAESGASHAPWLGKVLLRFLSK